MIGSEEESVNCLVSIGDTHSLEHVGEGKRCIRTGDRSKGVVSSSKLLAANEFLHGGAQWKRRLDAKKCLENPTSL